MSILINDPDVAQQLKADRELSGADRWDEVWEGTYVMNPLPNLEHQRLQSRLCTIFVQVLGFDKDPQVFASANVSDRIDGWEHNFRAPDVAVYMPGNSADDCGAHWRGGPDMVIEIASPFDTARNKIPFYEQVNTRELFILDRSPWALEQLALENGRLVSQGQSTCESAVLLTSRVLPVTLRLISGTPRPRVEVVCLDDGRQWLV